MAVDEHREGGNKTVQPPLLLPHQTDREIEQEFADEHDIEIDEGGHVEISGLHFKRQQPHGGVGLAIGCFVGSGYGMAIGFGVVSDTGRNVSFVRPSRAPFAYDGALVGGFCGITVGGGFGAGLARGLGYAWGVESLLPVQLLSPDNSKRKAAQSKTGWITPVTSADRGPDLISKLNGLLDIIRSDVSTFSHGRHIRSAFTSAKNSLHRLAVGTLAHAPQSAAKGAEGHTPTPAAGEEGRKQIFLQR